MRWNFGKILRNINDKSGELFEFIFPSRCISCAEVLNDSNRGSLEIFCKLCADSVEERGENFCPVCGIRHQGITGVSECGDCIKNPKPFQRILYRFVYGGAIGDAVTAFKYRHNLFAGRRLVYETLAFHSDVIAGSVPDIIIPVPQHLLRYLVRSFSPTAYIASVLSAATSIPVGYNILRKVKFTRAQVGLSREERLNNLRGSFAVKKGGCSFIEGKNILLVDDVYTTGATASICAGLLKESGAKSVSLFVLARGES